MKKLIVSALMGLIFLTSVADAATISRIKVWSSGDTVKAIDLNAEYNNLLNETNGKETRLLNIENRFSSGLLLPTNGGTGLSSISANQLIYGSGTNTFAPLNLGSTLSISTGTLSVNQANLSHASIGGVVPVASGGTGQTTAAAALSNLGGAARGANSDITSLTGLTTPLSTGQGGTGQTTYTDGQLLIGNSSNSSLTKATLTPGSGISVTNGNGSITIAVTATAFPTAYQGSAAPVYASATSYTRASIAARSSDDTTNLLKTTSTTVSLSTTGLNALDAGTKANSTWYYEYAVTNGTTTGIMLSTVNESVTGTISSANYAYTKKRQLPFAVRVDGSGNIIPFIVSGSPTRPVVMWNVSMTRWTGSDTAGTANVLAGGTSATFATVGLGSFVPAISKQWIPHMYSGGGSAVLGTLRDVGAAAEYDASSGAGGAGGYVIPMPCTSQQVDYKRAGGTGAIYLDVAGFIVDQIN